MKRTIASIIGFTASSAFLLASVLNQNLVYNASMFKAQPAKFDTRLTEMHTNQKNGEFYATAKTANKVNLNRFFQMIKN